MKIRSTEAICQRSSVVVALTCLSMSTPLAAQSAGGDSALKDPHVRQALERLVKKYRSVEKEQQQVLVTKQSSTTGTSQITTPSDLSPAAIDNSQNSDALLYAGDSDTSEIAEKDELVEGSRFSEGEELILGLDISSTSGPTSLADVFAYKSADSAKVGFTTLVQLLELPINIGDGFSSASGWLFNEANIFKMKVTADESLEVSVNNKNWLLSKQDYVIESDDIYIEIDKIAEWFGFAFAIDESRLKLTLTSQRQFPVEIRTARRNREVSNQRYSNTSVMPYRETGYKAFSAPLFDAQVSTSYSDSETSGSYSVVGSHDLAYLNTRYYLSGNKDKLLGSARITFARESDKNDLLGPLKATEFEVGDVLPVGNVQGSSRNLGRGFRFSNTPLVSSVDGRKVNLTGDVQDGWDVELYRNGILIGQQFGISEGRYEFTDVDLEFGENNFELVFYGPQGQVETKTESFNVDSNSVGEGQFSYQFSAVEANKSVFDLEEQNYGDDTEDGKQANLVMGYGVTDWLSLSSSVGLLKPDEGEDQKSTDFGYSANLFNMALLSSSIGEVKDSERNTAHSLRTRLFDTSFSFAYQNREAIGLNSENNSVALEAVSASMSGRLFSDGYLPLGYQNQWRREENREGVVETYSNSLGINTRIGSFSNNLFWRKQQEFTEGTPLIPETVQFDDPSYVQTILEQLQQEQDALLTGSNELPMQVSGGFQYRKSFNSVFTRLFANYTLKPESEFTSYGVSISYPFTPDISSNFSLFHYTLTDQYSSNLGLNWRLEKVFLSATASYNSVNGWSGGLNARVGFGFNDNTGYFASNNYVSQSGLVTARVFEDKNLNGTRDKGEPLIKNATVKALQGGSREAETNSNGLAVLTGISNNVKTDIVVERSSFEDPSMKTLIPGVALTARRGYQEHIDFPVTTTGELEGNLFLRNENGDMEPAAYALIQLVDEKGKTVDTAQSEYDGYYLFVDIVPGKYRVMVDKSFTRRRNMRIADPVYLAVRGGDVVNGTDIMLQQKTMSKGFAADMGSFSSLTVLKAYWSLLARSGMNVAKLRPFYLQDEESGRYVLRAGFYKDQETASDICDRIRGRKLKCTVNEFEAKL